MPPPTLNVPCLPARVLSCNLVSLDPFFQRAGYLAHSHFPLSLYIVRKTIVFDMDKDNCICEVTGEEDSNNS